MKHTVLFAVIALTILAGSCKKDKDNIPPADPSTSLMLKRMAWYDTTGLNYSWSESWQYDSLGRLSQKLVDIPHWMDSVVHKYHYSPSKVIVEYFYLDTLKGGRYIYSLNDLGLAVADTSITYDYNGDSTITSTAEYEYNPNGYLIRYVLSIGGDTTNQRKESYQIQSANRVCTYY